MKVLYERVAGIDVHKDMIKVAIRSPGEKPWTRKTEILEYRTFYGVLQAMAAELRRRGVTHVVMEASGACTEPVYYALAEQDFLEVAVINPAHAKALKGHKTDQLTEQRDVAAAQKARPPLPLAATLTGMSCSAGPGCCDPSLGAAESGHPSMNGLPAFSSLPLVGTGHIRPAALVQPP